MVLGHTMQFLVTKESDMIEPLGALSTEKKHWP